MYYDQQLAPLQLAAAYHQFEICEDQLSILNRGPHFFLRLDKSLMMKNKTMTYACHPQMRCTCASFLLTLYSSYSYTPNFEDKNQTVKTNNEDEGNATDDSDI